MDNDIVREGNTWVHNAFGNFLFLHYLSSVHLERPKRRDTGPGLGPSGSSSLVSEVNGFVELIVAPGSHCSLVQNSISGLKINFLALHDHDLIGVTLSWTGR